MMRTWGELWVFSITSRSGSTKAPVLPEPVLDWTMMSWAFRIYGEAFFWTSIRSLHPFLRMTSWTVGENLSKLMSGKGGCGSLMRTDECSSGEEEPEGASGEGGPEPVAGVGAVLIRWNRFGEWA